MAAKKKAKTKYDLKRPPVVTMLGHVDHGKTSILDAIRGTKIQTCEAGGITQNVRAHQIDYKADDGNTYPITFIDTPGHEAFSKMRSRGASVTDIVVLVVALNDSVQPQTKEAIKFAQKAKVPIIVALNKVDIEGVDKKKVKRELSQVGVQSEDLGGDVMMVETSATKKIGLDELLDAILLVAELSQLKKKKPKKGKCEVVVMESTLDKSLGAISLCLVKSGELKVGNYYLWDNNCGKIRALKDETYCDKDGATIAEPVWIAGFDEEVPVGTVVSFYEDEKSAKQDVKEEKKLKSSATMPDLSAGKQAAKQEDGPASSRKKQKIKKEEEEEEEDLDPEILAQLLEGRGDEDKPKLNLIVRTDSQGTLEVVKQELEDLSSDEVEINIIDSATGDITEDDIITASNVSGIVIGFKTNINKKVQRIAKQEKVLVRNYEIIYELLEEIADVVESLMKPEEHEVEVARALVKKVFELSDGSFVAGCKVTKGTIVKGYRCYVERLSLKKDNRIGEAKITSLKHGKEEVREAVKDTECGILLDPQLEIEKADEIVCFKIEKE